MERLLGWYRVSSSYGAVVALVAANAVPLLGVLFLGWNVWTILVLYWIENGIVGVINVLKIARAEGPDTTDRTAIAQNPVPSGAKVALIPFFVIHYGLFWFVHGIFVLTLPLFTGMFASPFGDPDPQGANLDGGAILFGALALAISHGISFLWNFLRGREYLRISAARQMWAPYGRLVALHVTIILGAMAVIFTGAPAAAVAILVAAKTLLDLGFHLAEHRRLETGTA